MTIKKICYLSLFILAMQGCDGYTKSSDTPHFPNKGWMQYANLQEAGWDENIVDEAVTFADSINTAAFMLIEDGVVVASYGETSRRYMCHSVRKSLISALYGIYVEKNTIDTSKTIAELGIDDIGRLTDAEKQAQIIHLLKSKSGIFHPAASETDYMANTRPPRGSHDPGTFWFYNNWDFNVLGQIFIQETSEDLFEAFNEQIAKPVGMEDYQPHHGYYHLEAGRSQFPSYLFRLSARDMARFGLLFERNGNWNGHQIISGEWIQKSKTPYSTELGSYSGSGYGFMWWLLEDEFDEYGGGYSALGVGEQTITILPEKKIVFVHRTNTYQRNQVSRNNIKKLMKMLLDAKMKEPDSTPKLIPHTENSDEVVYKDFQSSYSSYVGEYTYPGGISFEIKPTSTGLRFIDSQMGNYNLLFTSDTSFVLEDRLELFYKIQKDGKPMLISERIANRDGYFYLNNNRIDEALDLLRINTFYYPGSFNVYDSMGEALLLAGDTLAAIENYKRSINLNPNNTRALWTLMELNVDGFQRIALEPGDVNSLSGEYTIGTQTLQLQAKGNNLFIITQGGQNEILLIPLAKDRFIVSRGNHDIFDFSIGNSQDEFNIITSNRIIGKWVKIKPETIPQISTEQI